MGVARVGSSRFPAGGWDGGGMRRIIAAFAVVVAGFAVVPQVAVGAFIERVSVATNGTQANRGSYLPAISADGRYVAFVSLASNLVPGDTNGSGDVFVRDLRSGTTERVSVATDGTQANRESYISAISADGRYVTFVSYASDLVPGRHEQRHRRVRARPAGGHDRAG
jgi:uncharacterized membrane protein